MVFWLVAQPFPAVRKSLHRLEILCHPKLSGLKKVIFLRRVRLTHQEWRVRRALRILVPWKTILQT
jgi:hypothetical protein